MRILSLVLPLGLVACVIEVPKDTFSDDTGEPAVDSDDSGAGDDSGADDSGADDSGADDSGASDPDADGDGYPLSEDCDDADPDVNPGAEEICGDGVDNDCDQDAEDCSLGRERMAGDADAYWVGEVEGGQLGGPIRAVGDLRRDGTPDILLSERGYGEAQGAVHVFSQVPSGRVAMTRAITLTGSAGDEVFGAWGVGDLNGDGDDDLIVAGKQSDLAFEDAGVAYILYGPLDSGGALVDAQDVTLTGEATGDEFGILAKPGDLNGDGRDDLLISAAKSDVGGSQAGSVYYWQGGATTDQAPDAILRGTQEGAQLGGGLAGVGDVNGDGTPDVMAGAPYYDVDGVEDVGAAFLFHGPLSGELDGPESAQAMLFGAGQGDELGWGIAAAGDHDGDGYDDLLVNAQRADMRDNNGNEGAIYLVHGPLEGEISADTLAITIWGESSDDRLSAVSGGGDANGDGQPDLVLGSRFNDQGAADAGAAWLLLGPVPEGSHDVDDVGTTRFLGHGAGDGFGAHVGFVPDMNRDGTDELIFSARWDDDGGQDAGVGSLFYGAGE